jgi:nitrite reductase/ring-hydroxylating ferredoxin subunit
MSDALNYLIKARPEAMKAYFTFLKESGKHQWAFDVASGECVAKGDRPLTQFDSKIEQGRLLAYW